MALRGEPLVGQQKANASGWLRSQDEASISSDDLPRLRALRTPSIPERGRLLLQYLASTNPAPGAHIQIKFGSAEVQAVARSEGDQVGPLAIPFIVVEYLIKQRGLLLAFSHENMQGLLATISPAGWAYLDTSRGRVRNSPYAFVAMRFADETRALREEGLKPAIVEAGFDTRIMDEVDHNKHIDDMIIANIRRCRFLIADLTFNRQNVYYEAAFAQGLGLEVIWTVREDHLDATDEVRKLHIDVRQFNYVAWSDGKLPDFRERLRNRIIRTVGLGPKRPA